jgi:hypothetical protein
MLARPLQVLRWLGHLLSPPKAEQQATVAAARITVHSSAVDREDRGAAPGVLVDRMIGRDRGERARLAWLRAMEAYVRAFQRHSAAAAVHARLGCPERAALAAERADVERAGYEAAIADHPEWAADAPAWQEVETNTSPGLRTASSESN